MLAVIALLAMADWLARTLPKLTLAAGIGIVVAFVWFLLSIGGWAVYVGFILVWPVGGLAWFLIKRSLEVLSQEPELAPEPTPAPAEPIPPPPAAAKAATPAAPGEPYVWMRERVRSVPRPRLPEPLPPPLAARVLQGASRALAERQAELEQAQAEGRPAKPAWGAFLVVLLVAFTVLVVIPALWRSFEVPDQYELIGWLGGATVLALASAAYRLKGARLMEDRPTARIASAPQGYVELVGTAAGLTQTCAATGEDCVWLRSEVLFNLLFARRVELLVDQKSDRPFELNDGSATCAIDPKRATMEVEKLVWYSSQPPPMQVPSAQRRWLSRIFVGTFSSFLTPFFLIFLVSVPMLHYGPVLALPIGLLFFYFVTVRLMFPHRYVVRRIRPRDTVYVLGTFTTVDGRHHVTASGREERPFIVSTRPQHQLAGEWRRRVLPLFALFVALLVLTLQVVRFVAENGWPGG